VKTARAVFLLSSRTNSLGMSDAESDALTIMRAVAFRKYRPNITIFAQVILPRSTYHITGLVDHVLCIDEFKLGMIVIM
jgi:hypothetical protein